ncbi:MAG: ABC transporter ATP-binding protein [Planctomycetales bacterium]|nr:ABC transporter ATP-binding protein [Planctomycetales bacterium]
MPKLVVDQLSKEFCSAAERLTVLQGVSFSLSDGDNMSIVGPSGCGKSTLLYILGTLDQPTAGTVELDGVAPFDLPPTEIAKYRNENIGFVFQDHHLLPQLSVQENVLLPAMAVASPSQDNVDRANKLIDDVGLNERRRHLPGQLSGGERQRVAVARALLNSPKLLLADEPTGNLDESNTARIAELLFELPRREGAMLIVVTHSVWLAEQAKLRMQLREGKLAQIGALE